jgi:hypothetical protein
MVDQFLNHKPLACGRKRVIGRAVRGGWTTMKPVLSFVSLMAIGLIAASAIALVGASLTRFPAGDATPLLDYRSLSIGLIIGLMLSWLARLSWAEMPRRILNWLWANERNFYRAGLALVLVGVLIFY